MKKHYEKLKLEPVWMEGVSSIMSASIVNHATIQTMGQEKVLKSFDEESATDFGHTFNQDWEGGSLN